MKFQLKGYQQFINESHAPKLFYRGDHSPRQDFATSAYGAAPGLYFTTNQHYAESYGEFITVAYLNLHHPLEVMTVNEITDWNFDYVALQQQGYDGLLYTEPTTGEMIVYAFYAGAIQVLRQYQRA